jgi:hypothetical protein
MVRDRDVERVLRNEPEPQRAAEALVAAANDAGGEDNITVVIIDVLDADVGAEPRAVEPVEAIEPAAEDVEPAVAARPKGSRLRTVRGALLVLLPLVLILGIAAGVLGWYARRSYFVGASGSQVVIFKGVPGGVLGWTRRSTGAPASPSARHAGRSRPCPDERDARSLSTVQAYVDRLQSATTTIPAPTTTTTTIRRAPSTTRPRVRRHAVDRPPALTVTQAPPAAAVPDRMLARRRRRASSRSDCSSSRSLQVATLLASPTDPSCRPTCSAAGVGVRPLPRRPPRGAPLRAGRRRDAAPARRDAQRHRVRVHRALADLNKDYAAQARIQALWVAIGVGISSSC